jgi:hypothetical protein
LIFKYHINADESIKKVRMKRPKCIESSEQREYCNKFYTFIKDLRMIFTKEKKDIYSFIKHQNDLLLKIYNNQKNYENETTFIPKILTICFNKMIELKNANQITNINICKALNGSYDINDNMYNIISSIMENINKGNWKQIERCQDVIILSELLFIWLDDCVKACVYPETMQIIFDENKKLFKEKKSFIDYIFEYKNLDNETIANMYSYIKSIFKKYEWEMLKFFATFLKAIYPLNNRTDKQILEEETNEYKHMLEKFSIFILGYNIDILYENDDEESKNYSPNYFSKEKTLFFNNVQFMILILKFLRDTLTENKLEYFNDEVNCLHSPRKSRKSNNKNLINIDMNRLTSIESNGMNTLNTLLESPYHQTSLLNVYKILKLHFEKNEALNKISTNDNGDDNDDNTINPNKLIKIKKKADKDSSNKSNEKNVLSSKNSFNFELKNCDYISNNEENDTSIREKVKRKFHGLNYKSSQNVLFDNISRNSSNKKLNIFQIKNFNYQEKKPLQNFQYNKTSNFNQKEKYLKVNKIKNNVSESFIKYKTKRRNTLVLNEFFNNELKNSTILKNNKILKSQENENNNINNNDISSNNSSLLKMDNNIIHIKNNN